MNDRLVALEHHLAEGTDSRQLRRAQVLLAGELLQAFHRLVAGVEHERERPLPAVLVGSASTSTRPPLSSRRCAKPRARRARFDLQDDVDAGTIEQLSETIAMI